MAVAPLACGVATAGLLIFLHRVIGLVPGKMPELAWYDPVEIDATASLTAGEIHARVAGGTAIAGLWAASIASMVASVWAVRATVQDAKRTIFVGISVGVLVLVGLLGIALNAGGAFFGSDVSSGLYRGVRLSSGWLINDVTSVGNVIVFTGAVSLGLAFVSILRSPVDEPLHLFVRRLDALRVLLYASAVVLVMGTFEVAALYRWPACAVACDVQVHAVHAIASTMSLGAGGAGSLILASLYIPSALLLEDRTRHVARAAEVADGRQAEDEWLSKQGLLPNVGQRLREIGAVAAPFIAGSGLTQLLERFSDAS